MRRSLILVPVLLVASLGFSGLAHSEITYQVFFSQSDLSFKQANGFDIVRLADCVGSQDVGYPDLPAKLIHLILPEHGRATSVSVIERDRVELQGEYLVAPRQADNKTDDASRREPIKPDPQVYGSDSLYPGQPVEIIEQGYLGGSHLVTLAVHPLQYQPLSRRLFLHTRLKLKVETEGSGLIPSSSQVRRRSLQARRLYERILNRFVDNKIDVPNLIGGNSQPAPSGSDSGDSSSYLYLVVTSPELESSFLPLVEWKTKKGVPSAIVTLDSILANYSGRDDAEKLRNFLIQAYGEGTVWVLLGGDEDVVPVRYAYPTNTSTPPSTTDRQICDLYFSDVDGEWDLDNDDVWGEPQHDNPDIYPDLFVGRVPCSDTAEAGAFVQKLLSYEKNPGNGQSDYLMRALWMSSDQMADWDAGTGQHNLVAPYIPSNFYQDLTTLIESPTGDAENPVGPNGETCVEVMNQGWGIIGVLAHGKANGFVAKSNFTNGSPKSWVLTVPGAEDGHGHMPLLENQDKYGIMYSISCSQSAIDVDKYIYLGGEPCVGEFYPLVSEKGGVAFLGYSRWGWVSISYKLFEKFLEHLFEPDLGHHIGVAEALSRCAYPSYRDIDYGHNLFGDPEMPVWTETPGNMTVIHPEEVTAGEQTVHLSVWSGGKGVGSAEVCLVLQGKIKFSGETDQEGDLSCQVNLDDVGEMSLVVIAPDFIPYQDSITVSLGADVDDDETGSRVGSFELLQNYPNPFNPVTSIGFSVQNKSREPVHTSIRIYNILGRLVKKLVDEPKPAGGHVVNWDGTDSKGEEVSSGIYFYTLAVGDYRETKKMTLLK
jgi:hypothetical protein